VVDSISNIALQGLNDARMKMQKNASDIARSGTDLKSGDPVNVATSMVELKQNELVAEANIKVIKAEDEMLGTILDIKA
jgi:flagellar basal body rod protein FlgG